jgi:hypothetical protein
MIINMRANLRIKYNNYLHKVRFYNEFIEKSSFSWFH